MILLVLFFYTLVLYSCERKNCAVYRKKQASWNGLYSTSSFLARDLIYTSRACATMSVSSVCVSVCDVSALAHYS